MHILIFRKQNLKLQNFSLFPRFVRALSSKVSSSEEPANTMSIYRVRNGDELGMFFHPFSKIMRKSGHSLVENPRKRAEKTMALNGQNLNWSRACVHKTPLCSTSHRGAYPPLDDTKHVNHSTKRRDSRGKNNVPMMLFSWMTILAELAERSPIIIKNSSNTPSRKNLDLQPYDRTRCHF